MSHKKGLDTPEGSNWIVSYADLMQFLLFLFIMLYAMQSAKQLAAPADSVTSSPSSLSSQASSDQGNAESSQASSDAGGSTVKTGKPYYYVTSSTAASENTGKQSSPANTQSTASSKSSEEGKPTYQDVQSFVSANNLQKSVSVVQGETGIVFDIQAEILFDPGSSQIRSESLSILSSIGKYLATLKNDVIIAGYTDNQPITTGSYQSNWELSCDRATKVLRYFTDTASLAPQRFQAVGYGEYRPIADNSTESGRQQNRRVEIIVVKTK